MATKKSVSSVFPDNENVQELVKALDLEMVEKPLLQCFEEVIASARRSWEHRYRFEYYYLLNEELMNSKKVELQTIAEAYGINERQAALLAIVIELSSGDEVSKKDLAEQMKTSFVTYLSYENDLVELEKLRLIKIGDWHGIKIREEVTDLLRDNKAYRKPSSSGLTTNKILSRMSRLFNEIGNDGNKRFVLEDIDDMILSNPDTGISKVADSYGILKRGDRIDAAEDEESDRDYCRSMGKMERMLFYALLHRYNHFKEDDCGWWDFRDYFSDDDFDSVQGCYKDGRLKLQEAGVMEYVNIDGMAVKDRFHLKDEVKEQILSDAGGLHERTPLAGLVEHSSISVKPMYYNDAVQRQVSSLENILSAKKFCEVREAMKAKGLRSGFTCLFYGAPGTGKTETVYQLARKTGRDLITADVTKIKSSWVGESEQNIKGLFSKYRRCVKESKMTPILLFNEADAIFGLRMKGAERAVDKMENSIQNIILQEMENLDGILIATTNLTQNMDKAFERRFLYKVNFDKPDAAIRSEIWHSMIPELNEEQALALSERFPFSGGQIENVSRKRLVQSLISGKEADFDEMLRFCEEENISGSREMRIGF